MEAMELWIMRNRFLAGILAGACLGLGLVILYAALGEFSALDDEPEAPAEREPAARGDQDDIAQATQQVAVAPLPPHLEIVNAGVGEGEPNHA